MEHGHVPEKRYDDKRYLIGIKMTKTDVIAALPYFLTGVNVLSVTPKFKNISGTTYGNELILTLRLIY